MHILQGPRLIAEPDILAKITAWRAWQEAQKNEVERVSKQFPLLQTAASVVERWNDPLEVDFRKLLYECIQRYDHASYEKAVLATDGTHWPLWRFGMDTWNTARMVAIIFQLEVALATLVKGAIPEEPQEDEWGDPVAVTHLKVRTPEDYLSSICTLIMGMRYRRDQNLPAYMEELLAVCKAAVIPGTVKYALSILGHARRIYEHPYLAEEGAGLPRGSFVKAFERYDLSRWADTGTVGTTDRAAYGIVEHSLCAAGEHLLVAIKQLQRWSDADDPMCPAYYLTEVLTESLHLAPP